MAIVHIKWFAPEHKRYMAAANILLEQAGLTHDSDVEELAGLYDGKEMVAVAARSGNVLKEFAVRPDRQGEDLMAALLTALRKRLFELGITSCKVYTKTEHLDKFTPFGFSLVARGTAVVLLESGSPGITDFVAGLRELTAAISEPPERRGCIVLNANPFTCGHRYLVGKALQACNRLFLIMVREERSLFPYAVRRELVARGCADLPGVTLLDGGDYVISSATFPRYFIKEADSQAQAQAELDIDLFLRYIAPALEVTARFAGTEPEDALTSLYNDVMRRELPPCGLNFVEVPRMEREGQVISASKVRRAYQAGALEAVANMLPPATLAYLQTHPYRKENA